MKLRKLSLVRETLSALTPQQAPLVGGGRASDETTLPSVDTSVFIRSCPCVHTVWCSEVATYCVETYNLRQGGRIRP